MHQRLSIMSMGKISFFFNYYKRNWDLLAERMKVFGWKDVKQQESKQEEKKSK